MTTQVTATVVGGTLKLDQALPLPDQTRFQLTIKPIEEWSPESVRAAWEALKTKADVETLAADWFRALGYDCALGSEISPPARAIKDKEFITDYCSNLQCTLLPPLHIATTSSRAPQRRLSAPEQSSIALSRKYSIDRRSPGFVSVQK
jgi:hypothetical protein